MSKLWQNKNYEAIDDTKIDLPDEVLYSFCEEYLNQSYSMSSIQNPIKFGPWTIFEDICPKAKNKINKSFPKHQQRNMFIKKSWFGTTDWSKKYNEGIRKYIISKTSFDLEDQDESNMLGFWIFIFFKTGRTLSKRVIKKQYEKVNPIKISSINWRTVWMRKIEQQLINKKKKELTEQEILYAKNRDKLNKKHDEISTQNSILFEKYSNHKQKQEIIKSKQLLIEQQLLMLQEMDSAYQDILDQIKQTNDKILLLVLNQQKTKITSKIKEIKKDIDEQTKFDIDLNDISNMKWKRLEDAIDHKIIQRQLDQVWQTEFDANLIVEVCKSVSPRINTIFLTTLITEESLCWTNSKSNNFKNPGNIYLATNFWKIREYVHFKTWKQWLIACAQNISKRQSAYESKFPWKKPTIEELINNSQTDTNIPFYKLSSGYDFDIKNNLNEWLDGSFKWSYKPERLRQWEKVKKIYEQLELARLEIKNYIKSDKDNIFKLKYKLDQKYNEILINSLQKKEYSEKILNIYNQNTKRLDTYKKSKEELSNELKKETISINKNIIQYKKTYQELLQAKQKIKETEQYIDNIIHSNINNIDKKKYNIFYNTRRILQKYKLDIIKTNKTKQKLKLPKNKEQNNDYYNSEKLENSNELDNIKSLWDIVALELKKEENLLSPDKKKEVEWLSAGSTVLETTINFIENDIRAPDCGMRIKNILKKSLMMPEDEEFQPYFHLNHVYQWRPLWHTKPNMDFYGMSKTEVCDNIQIWDWLLIYNWNSSDPYGTHSWIFIGWQWDQALVASLPAWRKQKPKISTYDIRNTQPVSAIRRIPV